MTKHPKWYLLITFKNKYFTILTQLSSVLIKQLLLLLFPTAVATINFTTVGYLDNNTWHAECTVQFRWTENLKVFKECRVAWSGYSSDEYIWLSIYYLYKSIYHLHYCDCAVYKPTSSWTILHILVSLLSHAPSPPISPSWCMCIMMSMTYGTTLSLSKYSFWIFSTCFQYPCYSHPLWQVTPAVISGGAYLLWCFQVWVSLI
jgi:hypothetical protein